jgi:hypothetical protein
MTATKNSGESVVSPNDERHTYSYSLTRVKNLFQQSQIKKNCKGSSGKKCVFKCVLFQGKKVVKGGKNELQDSKDVKSKSEIRKS